MQNWTFLHATDVHIGSPRSFRFMPAWNENWQQAKKQMLDIPADLILIGGDVARDGNIHHEEMLAARSEFESLPFPYYIAPGNMDAGNKHTDVDGLKPDHQESDTDLNMTSEQLHNYRDIFGEWQWSFVHKNVRFTGFCDMLAGSGLPEEKAFWEWMEAQKDQPRAQFHVWVMHSPLFIDEPNEPNVDITSDQYLDWYFNVDQPQRGRILEIMKATGANVVISGHVHCRKTHIFNGIRFDIAPSTAFFQLPHRWPDGDTTLGFLRYDVSDEGIACTFVPLEKVSKLEGYGPGGHPASSARDYSIAWEK